VGLNAWVAHRNSTVFGPDPDAFRPERWLDSDADQRAHMDRYFMPVSFPFSALTLSQADVLVSPRLVEITSALREVPSLRSLDHTIAHTWRCAVWHGSSNVPRKEYRFHGPEQGNIAASTTF
jgi:hypothetical protein